jgi:hypothetical protein
VPSGFVYRRWRQRDRAFDNLFGLSQDSFINLVLATYQNRIDYNAQGPHDRRYRYFKETTPGERTYLEGARSYILGLDTATTAILSVIELGKLTSRELNVLGDEEQNKAKDGPFISLGSPTSNRVTESILASLPGNRAIRFDTNSLKCWLHPQPYLSTPKNDYAVLVRVQQDNQVRFACSGIDEEGTVAVARYLMHNWRSLPSTNFVRVFKCDKNSLELEQLAAEPF